MDINTILIIGVKLLPCNTNTTAGIKTHSEFLYWLAVNAYVFVELN